LSRRFTRINTNLIRVIRVNLRLTPGFGVVAALGAGKEIRAIY
jgi:hypothetical protein